MLASQAETEIWAAEPCNFDDTKRSLEARTALSIEPGHSSICDSIVTARPGRLTFPINLKTLSGGYSVNEPDVVTAMRVLFTELKVVAEPGGAVSVAAAWSNKEAFQGQTIVALVSGGNVDMDSFLGWMI
jgi:threonine dehydratase